MTSVTEEQVIQYLQAHPDFFINHEDLLLDLQLPRPDGSAVVSLVERQLTLLREAKQRQERQLNHLRHNARENEKLLHSLQQLITALIDTTSLTEAIDYLRTALQEDFFADIVKIKIFADSSERPEYIKRSDDRIKPLNALLERRGSICGQLKPEQNRAIFGDKAENIASSVVMPICDNNGDHCIGLMAIGSSDAQRYHPDMGTIFINHLGSVINKVFRAHIGKEW